MRYFKLTTSLLVLEFFLLSVGAFGKIKSISIEGNKRVGDNAIIPLVKSKVGGDISPETISEDIKSISELGFFSHIDVYKKSAEDGEDDLFYVLKEKPAIKQISFVGMGELSEGTIRDELNTKLYTIIDTQKLRQDLSMIEKKYHEKGFFLVDVSYRIEKVSETESEIYFEVAENGKILVAEVSILGNQFFTDGEILTNFMSQPYTNLTAISSRSIYNRDFVTRDVEYLSYLYKDNGFADVSVSEPVIHIDRDKSFARITLRVEEGIQYKLASLSIGGDIGPDLYTQDELLAKMNSDVGKIFKVSDLHKDVSTLSELYGNLGYAYADINPIPLFNKEEKTVKIHFDITKGKKVYFGKILIIGNTKTRQNVIRRELTVYDGELYSGTGLSSSKRKIHRLGYFEEVKFKKKPSETENDVIDLEIDVKEQSTGQLQASVGFSPGGKTSETWFAQGRYDEKNQFGRGWSLGLEGKWSGSDNLLAKISFANPRVLDSHWHLGGSFSYDSKMMKYAQDYESQEKEIKFDLTVGRTIFELIRGYLTYTLSINKPHEENIFLASTDQIIASSVTFKISRYDLDNLLDPTEGLGTSLSHTVVGLWGNQKYMETEGQVSYYLPIDFTDHFRTYFKFNLVGGYLWKFEDTPLPYNARYRLGGFYDLRGYYFGEVSPIEKVASSPTELAREAYKGGDRKLFTQIEYFVPIIKAANIKGLVFFDSGMVCEEGEIIDFADLKSDVGFGFRWKTPIAPFRFEWAYPLSLTDGEVGDMKFIFSLGY